MAIVRFEFPVKKNFLEALDNFTEENLFKNRSQAIRHLINNTIVKKNGKEMKL